MSSKLSPGSKNTKPALVEGHFICSLSSLQFPWLLFPFPSSPLIPRILISRNLWIVYGNIPLASRAHATLSLCHTVTGACWIEQGGECEIRKEAVLRRYSPTLEERAFNHAVGPGPLRSTGSDTRKPSSLLLILQSPRGDLCPPQSISTKHLHGQDAGTRQSLKNRLVLSPELHPQTQITNWKSSENTCIP